MPNLTTWGEVITNSFQNLWIKVISFLPNVIIAILFLLVGLLVAKFFSKFITRTLKYLYFDKAADSLGIKEELAKIGIKVDLSKVVGLIVNWFFIIVFLVAAADILKFTQITEFLNKVLLYIPKVIIAAVILIIGVVFANFINGVVKTSVHVVSLESADAIAAIAKWAILIFSVMAALVQLDIAAELVSVLLKGFVAMLAISGGIAFGLGGQDKAKKIIDKLGEKK
ncbi:hypothetical protein A2Y83_00855 [Candidatus Falkowbacteria bacterium RBG_13_39_14]|uniref:Small-conductance mechanosensitive ion channel n=1 Tax=Candidatus Falkowbacteria bacterium RBG_13_39_14 TaxID=1797985 RepID=A0A1F5S8F9_9BACT|nr:MAG: hypothetical protein A2Y83_00855 [Candidatus Falkowbacteria bacterium RBG_13_39_14]